jgi:hypothetical protein
MFRHVLMASAMLVSAPVLAQERAPADKGQVGTNGAPASPVSRDGDPVASEAVPSATTPGAPKATPPAQASAAGATASATPATKPVKCDDGAMQTAPGQVRAIVQREFGVYDKNRSGALEKEEFAAWMAALKARSESKPGEPSKSWTEAAFKQADADKSASVNRIELAGFFNGVKMG